MSTKEELKEKLKLILDPPNKEESESAIKENSHFSTDLKGLKEQANWDNLQEETLHLANRRFENDTQKRDTLSTWAAILVSFWLICVLLILVGNTSTYKLESSVLIALLGTTTLNVLGLMFIVLKGLFGDEKTENRT